MQLTPASIRAALTRASYTLLSGAAAAQGGELGDGLKSDGAALFYSETGRVHIFEPVIQATQPLRDDEFVTLRGVIDIMSGASPSGVAPSTKSQTFSSPSGGTTSTTTPAYALPLQEFSDQRLAISLDWDTPLSERHKNLLGLSYSAENDYTSIGISDSLRSDFNDRLTTLTTGVAASIDGVSPVTGAPTPLTSIYAVSTQPSGAVDDDDFGNPKINASGLLGLTQVVNRRLLMQFNYSLSVTRGYLDDPYKLVSVVSPITGLPVDYLHEGRPHERVNQTLYTKAVLHLPSDVVHVSYRYFWDDWGVRAHTADLEYRLELPGGHYLRPHLRYHVQTGADFYRHSLRNGDPIPPFASADYRLAPMSSRTVGIRYGFNLSSKTQFGLRVARMLQTGVHHPADAIGEQRKVDMYPDLEAYIFQVDFSATF